MMFLKQFNLFLVFGGLCLVIHGTSGGKVIDLNMLPILKTPPDIVWIEYPTNDVTLPCAPVENIPHLSYSWEKNGEIVNVKSNPRIISNDENGTIIIVDAFDEDIGRYQCFVEQNLRVATSAMINLRETYLAVTENIVTHMATLTEPIQFDCPVESNPHPIYGWKVKDKNKSENLTDVVKDHLIMTDGSLWLFDITKEDITMDISYLCVVTSKVTNTSDVAAEHIIADIEDNDVKKNHLEELYTSGNIVAEFGKIAKLYCIYSGSPSPNITWMKDNKRILQSTSRITIDNKNRGQVLIINDVRVQDEGTYTCTARNKVNVPRRHQIEVIVVINPSIEYIEPVTKAIEGLPATITFIINAIPEPIVLWTVDAQQLFEDSADMQLTTIYLEGEPTKSHLTLKNVTHDNTGYYGCRAYNVYGETYSETLLYVMSV